jgi:hypothetical protein
MGLSGSANADFLAPAQLRITNLSRHGVGLGGVVRIVGHDAGVVTLYLPGTDEPTTVVASLAWSDRKGHVGLKFTEFRTIASQWRTWFTSPAADEEPGEATDEIAVPAKVSAELAAAWHEATVDLRTEWEQGERKSRMRRYLWQGFRIVAAVLVITLAGAMSWWWWQSRLSKRAATTVLRAPVSQPRTPASPPKRQVRVVTTVHVVEGKASLQAQPERGAPPPLIEGGKATRQPEVRYTGSPLAVGEQVVQVLLAIDQKGVVGSVTTIGGDPALARDVISTMGHWRYTPFLADSVPVNVKLPVTATFRTTRVPDAAAPRK